MLLLAAILSPTDAALGQAVVTVGRSGAVPPRLIVESGLNDGLALPLILLFASLIAAETDRGAAGWLQFAAQQVVLGPLAGVLIGWLGAKAVLRARDHGLTDDRFEGPGALAIAAACYFLALQIGGNGFMAAFAGGLAFGHVTVGRCKFVYEFAESEGLLLTWGAFFLVGVALVPDAIGRLDAASIALILGALFIARPAAIWLALLRSDASAPTRLFFGWFGPRGLATALFALIVLEQGRPRVWR